jgi:proline dehydrogenase
MVRAVASDPRFADPRARPTLSLKLSSYTTAPLDKNGGDAAGSREAVEQICDAAREHGVRVTIDMESRHWTDFTLDFVRALRAKGHEQVGCVLQTRLHRTEADLDRLSEGLRVRLVIGIYREPAAVALVDKEPMKERLLAFGERLLERGHYVELGTHDERYVRRFVDRALPRFGPERFEVQMLYGVPRERLQRELRDRGCRVRLYVPFALGWDNAIAYLRRRLDEYPAMMGLVLRNWFRRG